MNEIYENGGFVTKYGSSPYDMIECLHIRLALWTDYPSLTSENFNEIFIKISSNSNKYKFWDSYRSYYGNDIPFKFPESDCNDPMEFNVIFYLKKDGTAAGYTQFLEIQNTSEVNELWIYTHFKYNSEVSDLILKNSLESHIYENFLGNLDVNKSLDDTKYLTRKRIDSTYIETYQRFTNLVTHLLSDKNYSISTNSLLYSDDIKCKIKLSKVRVPYSNASIGIYNNDLVVCNWSEYMYRLTSLSKKDSSGDPIVYHSGNIRTSTSSGGYGLKDYSIRKVTPYCVVCYITVNPIQETAIICLDDNVVRAKNPYESFVNNPYTPRSGCIVNNSTMESIKFKDRVGSYEVYLNSVNSVYNMDIPGKLVRMEGSFSVFESGNKYYYANLEGSIISDSMNLMVLNDNCLMDQDNEFIYFYFTYNNSIIDLVDELDEKYSYLVYKVNKSDIRSPLISSLRRNKISYSNIPNILTTYGGIIFYKDKDDYLTYI